MAFKVELTFDTINDLFDLVQTFTKPDPRIGTVLTTISNLSGKVDSMSASMQSAVDRIRAAAERLDTVEDSVRAFIGGVPGMIADAVAQAQAAGASPEQLAALNELADRIGAETDGLANAVLANTQPAPAEPEVPVEPAPPVDEPVQPELPVDPAPVDPAAPGEGEPPVVTDPAADVTIPPDPNNGSTP